MTISVFGVPVEASFYTVFLYIPCFLVESVFYFRIIQKRTSLEALFLASTLSAFLIIIEPGFHELGHALTAVYIEGTIKAIDLLSLTSVTYSKHLGQNEMLIISMAGPLFGLIYTLVSAVIARYASRQTSVVFGFVAIVSFLDPLFNLLPFGGLDGASLAIFLHETFVPMMLPVGLYLTIYMAIYTGLAVPAMYILMKILGKKFFGR